MSIIQGGPESLFRLGAMQRADDGVHTVSMPSGPWLAGADGRGQPAAIGVLVDVVMGYVGNSHTTGWTLSTELSMEMVGDVPVDGRAIVASARTVHVDDDGMLVHGTVVDEAGTLIAHCSLRGRFTTAHPEGRAAVAFRDEGELDRSSLDSLLGDAVVAGPEGPLHVENVGDFVNPLGNIHGGMVLCLHELAAARAVPELDGTASVRLQLVRGIAAGERFGLTARVAHRGRSLAVVVVEARDVKDRVCSLSTTVRH